ncbi:MAG: hypothetical protein ACPGID_14105, partial [Rubricella sp.]
FSVLVIVFSRRATVAGDDRTYKKSAIAESSVAAAETIKSLEKQSRVDTVPKPRTEKPKGESVRDDEEEISRSVETPAGRSQSLHDEIGRLRLRALRYGYLSAAEALLLAQEVMTLGAEIPPEDATVVTLHPARDDH